MCVCVYVCVHGGCMHMLQHVCGGQKTTRREMVLFFHHVEALNSVMMLDGRLLCLLSHFTSPNNNFLVLFQAPRWKICSGVGLYRRWSRHCRDHSEHSLKRSQSQCSPLLDQATQNRWPGDLQGSTTATVIAFDQALMRQNALGSVHFITA